MRTLGCRHVALHPVEEAFVVEDMTASEDFANAFALRCHPIEANHAVPIGLKLRQLCVVCRQLRKVIHEISRFFVSCLVAGASRHGAYPVVVRAHIIVDVMVYCLVIFVRPHSPLQVIAIRRWSLIPNSATTPTSPKSRIPRRLPPSCVLLDQLALLVSSHFEYLLLIGDLLGVRF